MTIRVLHLINQVGYGGGSERQLLQNVKHLDPKQVVSVVCQLTSEFDAYSNRQAVSDLREIGVQVESLAINSKKAWPRALLRLIKLVKTERVEIIHTSLTSADLLGLWVGWLTKTPVIVSLVSVAHGPEWVEEHPHISKWKHAIFMSFYRFSLRHFCTHAIANSAAVKMNTVKHLGLSVEQVTVIHRSIDPNWQTRNGHDSEQELQKTDRLRAEFNLRPTDPVLLNVARVVPSKGQTYLVEAIARVKEQWPTVKLLIAGASFSAIDLAKLRDKLGLQENVLLLGHRNDVRELYRISHIGVFSSIYEGFANALVEACASGLPSVVTNIGGFTEIVDNNRFAVVVQPRSATALANGIAYLLANPTAATELGQCAQEHVLKTFTVQRAINALTDVYSKVIRSSCAS